MIQLTARCGGRAQPAPQGHWQSSAQAQTRKHVEVWPVAAAVHTCTSGEEMYQCDSSSAGWCTHLANISHINK